MKKNLLVLCAFFAFSALANSQTVIMDYETTETSSPLQFFGGANDGTVGNIIANPNASGINTSANVFEYVKAGDGMTWHGGFTNPDPMTAVDLTSPSKVCVDVHMDHIGNVAMKFENSTSGGANWIATVPNTVMGEWEQLCFDVTLNSEEDPFTPADGQVYARIVLFVDFGTAGTGTDVLTYLDNVVVESTSGTNDFTKVDDLFSLNSTMVGDNAFFNFSNNAQDNRNMAITAVNGATLFQRNIARSAATFELNVASWTPGVYFATVQEGKEIQVVKFLVY